MQQHAHHQKIVSNSVHTTEENMPVLHVFLPQWSNQENFIRFVPLKINVRTKITCKLIEKHRKSSSSFFLVSNISLLGFTSWISPCKYDTIRETPFICFSDGRYRLHMRHNNHTVALYNSSNKKELPIGIIEKYGILHLIRSSSTCEFNYNKSVP